MLMNWVGGISGRRQILPFSFADRGNLWPDEMIEASVTTMGRHEQGGIAQGLIGGTLVATELGWQPVEDLQVGDRVVTFDNGMRPLTAVRVSTLWTAASETPRSLWPLEIPAQALGNRSALRLLPEQPVLIESDAAEALYGDPFLMVAAQVLDGYHGIARVPPMREVTVVTLEFEGDEVVYANGTLLVHCPADRVELVHSAEELMNHGAHGHYQRLTEAQGRRLVEAMHAQG